MLLTKNNEVFAVSSQRLAIPSDVPTYYAELTLSFPTLDTCVYDAGTPLTAPHTGMWDA